MSQPQGIENNGGQGQGQANDQGTAFDPNGAIQFGQLNQQQPPPQLFGAPQGGQPPYQEYLDKIPTSLRGAVEPIFKEWDANTTQRFQDYSNQLQQLQPYQQFTQYDPQSLQLAVQLANMVSENPEQVFQMLADQLNYDLESDEDEDGSYYQSGNPQEDERWHAMEQALSQLTELVQGDRQQREEDQETEQILSQLASVEQQRGPLDYDFVLGKAYATGDLNGAVEEWYSRYAQAAPQQQQVNGNGQQQMVNIGGLQVPANHPAAQQAQGPPQPLASGGGLPSDSQDLGKLSAKERIALVAQTIHAANQAGQG